MKESDWIDIAKYLSGEMSHDKTKHFEDWINKSSENKELFNSVKMDWENFDKLSANVNEDKAWESLKNRLEQDGLFEEKTLLLRKESYRFMRVAAVILVLIVAGFFISVIVNSNDIVVKTTNNEHQVVLLPDGSKVTLYQNSKISYDKNFLVETRSINLEGEGFFEIERMEDIPFIVTTNTAKVKVLGTSFNVNTSKSSNNVEVYVKTGKVELISQMSSVKSIFLEPGDIGFCNNGDLNKLLNKDDNYIAWKTRDLVFKNTSLTDVIDVVEKVYMVDIDYDNAEIKDLRISTSFEKQKLETVLNVIAKTFGFSYSKKKNKVYLEKMN